MLDYIRKIERRIINRKVGFVTRFHKETNLEDIF